MDQNRLAKRIAQSVPISRQANKRMSWISRQINKLLSIHWEPQTHHLARQHQKVHLFKVHGKSNSKYAKDPSRQSVNIRYTYLSQQSINLDAFQDDVSCGIINYQSQSIIVCSCAYSNGYDDVFYIPHYDIDGIHHQTSDDKASLRQYGSR